VKTTMLIVVVVVLTFSAHDVNTSDDSKYR